MSVFRGGKVICDRPPLKDVRRRAMDQLAALDAGVRPFANPHQYPAGLDSGLHELKTRLILEARGLTG